MNNKPWFLLNPNSSISRWWKKDNIVDIEKSKIYKHEKDSLAHLIIQDGNMGGNFWYLSTWYIDDPNRYSSIYFQNTWPFNKELIEMYNNEIIYLTKFPYIKFKVYPCLFGLPEQNTFCKILERVLTE